MPETFPFRPTTNLPLVIRFPLNSPSIRRLLSLLIVPSTIVPSTIRLIPVSELLFPAPEERFNEPIIFIA